MTDDIDTDEAEEPLRSGRRGRTTYLSATRPERVVVLGSTRTAKRLKVVVARDDPALVITVAGRDEEG